MADNIPVPLNRTERTLAFMIAGVGGLSVLAIIAVFIGSAADANLSEGAWPVARVLPGIGLPIAFLMIIVFAVISVVRRRRIANGSK